MNFLYHGGLSFKDEDHGGGDDECNWCGQVVMISVSVQNHASSKI